MRVLAIVLLWMMMGCGVATAQVINSAPPDPSIFRKPDYPNAPRSADLFPNLDGVKQQLRDYYDSGNYDTEIGEVTAAAQKYLDQRLGKVQKPALVLDVDETAVTNWGYFLANDFGLVADSWSAWVDRAQAPAIASVGNLYRWARSRGVVVFFISGRLEKSRAATEKMLQSAGYDQFTLIMKPDAQKDTATTAFKTAARKQIQDQGYTVVVNLGDQQSDLDGGNAEKVFKIPNPIYVVP